VNDAKLRLYFDGICVRVNGGSNTTCGSTNHTIAAHKVTSQWTSASLGGDIAFDAAPLATFDLAAGATPSWMQWSVTSLVQQWVASAANHGILLKRTVETAISSGPRPRGSRYANSDTWPILEVTYTAGVELNPIETSYSNGAKLTWSTFNSPPEAFTKYEIHRSPTRNFTPTEATRLATITDVNATTYRDSTGSAGTEYVYKVVANSFVSNERDVVLPVADRVRHVVAPLGGGGKTTYISYHAGEAHCTDHGARPLAKVGVEGTGIKRRALVEFDVSAIPVNATVESGVASVWHSNSLASAKTVYLHRLTRSGRRA